ncbi:hypothetical protein CJU90_6628 [Yarrowia sp. C11]|nr:hypothetical protein CJU90_6628 [Yarrowia sp. C11]KAG5358739.1 hypothetical protein CKK34_5008 [Yarrowia sp. E02]
MTTVHREVLGDISNMKMGALSPLKSTGSPYRKPRGVCKSSLQQGPNKKLFTQDILSPLLLPPKSSEDCKDGNEGKIREHADRLKMRLQLALYKINTKQTNVSLAALEEASSSPNPSSATETPMRAPPGSLLKGTPASMGAAKSLLQLGNC